MTPIVTFHDDDLLPPLVRVLGAEIGFDMLRIGVDDGAFVIERASFASTLVRSHGEPTESPFGTVLKDMEDRLRSALPNGGVIQGLLDDGIALDEPIGLWPVAEPQTDPELVDHEILDMLDGKARTYGEIERGVANMLGTAAADMVNERLEGMVLAGTVAWRQTARSPRLYTLAAANGSVPVPPGDVEPVADGIRTSHGAGPVPGGEVAASPAATSPELDAAGQIELQRDVLDILATGTGP